MPTAYLFPGQGSHSVGMGHASFLRYPIARKLFEQADTFLGYKLSTLCFSGPEDQLTATEYQTPALFVVGMARWAIMQADTAWPVADFIVGQSMGMTTALAAAGAISFEDGLLLAQQRGKLMQKAGEKRRGAMAAVLGISAETVTTICQTIQTESGLIIQLASDSSPVQQLITGETKAVELAMLRLRESGARKVVLLPISIASHCDLMREMASHYAKIIEQVVFHDARVPLVSNVSAELIQTATQLRHEIIAHLTVPVRWRESMLLLRQLGVDTFIEVGPSDALTKLMKRIDRSATRKAYQA
ncbi:MAG TPA: [acyl-carrier-protein] S-malonyltransferase [Anaerolineae bacterium]|nr:[acyl-carrier-protein] S-malonyltransferase [Anaerolineae bacterium]